MYVEFMHPSRAWIFAQRVTVHFSLWKQLTLKIVFMQCYLYAVSSNSDEEFSIGAAIGITFIVTLILSVTFTLLVAYILHKVWIVKQKTTTDVEDNLPLSAEPIVSANNSDVHEFPDDDQSTSYQSNPLATVKPNSSHAMHKFDDKDDIQVSDNIE